MRKLFALLLVFSTTTLCAQKTLRFRALLDSFHESYLRLNPVLATLQGDSRYNHLAYVDFTDSYREKLRRFNQQYLDALKRYNPTSFSAADRLSYDILQWRLADALEELKQPDNLVPFNHMWGLPLIAASWGSGGGAQPFKTVADYNAWLQRLQMFPAWADSAILYMRRGMAQGITLPKGSVNRMLPALGFVGMNNPKTNPFYWPVNNFPTSFTAAEKEDLTARYTDFITTQLLPAYDRLRQFLQTEYIAVARTQPGIGSLPGGAEWYRYKIWSQSTTNLSPDSIFNLGMAEIARIKTKMETIKKAAGYDSSLLSYLQYLRTSKQFLPYKTAEEVLAAYRAMQQTVDSAIRPYFTRRPHTTFEIRQTEPFITNTSPFYQPGDAAGRPGIFYIPIPDATKQRLARPSLFVHEALPGHHFEVMLQRENKGLPAFRQGGAFPAYSEGWASYCENLAAEIGLYKTPYEQMAALQSDLGNCVGLVVEIGLHHKGWTREEAVKFLVENGNTPDGAAASVDRVAVQPGQGLTYKIGRMKMLDLRRRCEQALGSKFNLSAFHNELLKDGAMPLDILERKMMAWVASQKSRPATAMKGAK